jgi:hypothetical protein|tara:strand:+ start:3360 stop:3590 length:231 start_codon:yes stop_codon:yes gene_type:complete
MDSITVNDIEPYSSELFKMMFIYNTLLNGWSVKMISKNKFEFNNNDRKIKKNFYGDSFIKEFIEKNMNKISSENIA